MKYTTKNKSLPPRHGVLPENTLPTIGLLFKLLSVTLLIKILSVLAWAGGLVGVQALLPGNDFSPAGIGMVFIEVLVGLFPFYVVWVLLFLGIRFFLLKGPAVSFRSILQAVLVLNLLELLLAFGHLNRLTVLLQSNGLFSAVVWAALPDVPEVMLTVLVSFLLARVWCRQVEWNGQVR